MTHLQETIISPTYIVPAAHAPEDPELLAGRELWIALRKDVQCRLYAKLRVSLVEQFEDGINTEDYILTIDQSSSFELSRDQGQSSH